MGQVCIELSANEAETLDTILTCILQEHFMSEKSKLEKLVKNVIVNETGHQEVRNFCFNETELIIRMLQTIKEQQHGRLEE